MIRTLLAPLRRLDLALTLWADPGLAYTWRRAWRAAARHL